MKRSTLFAVTALLAAGFVFIGTGCQGDGEDAAAAETASTMPDQADQADPADQASSDHPTGDKPKADHPK